MRILAFASRLDPGVVPIEGKCLAVTEGHQSCPLFKIREERKSARGGSL